MSRAFTRRRFAVAVPLVGFGLLMAVAGCGEGTGGRQSVSGQVTFKGQPLDQGTIQFVPTDAAKDAAPGVAQVAAGKYEMPAASGLKPGPYKVIISATAGPKVNESEAPGDSDAPAKELIPPAWNVDSKHTVEVKTGPNKFDFSIP